MNDTGIIWTEHTWNPNSGCTKITSGCAHCYAYTLAENKRGTAAFPKGFDLTIREHKLREPFKLKTPSLIFVNSMSDLFWEQIPESYRDKIVDVIEATPQHEYQVLTKRPEAMLTYSRRRALPLNFWAGVTIESRKHTDRLDILRDVRASLRFVSFEPILDNVGTLDLSGIHWAITGGESGAHLTDTKICERRGLVTQDAKTKRWTARADRMDWVRTIRDQCTEQGVKFFHKQWGGYNSHSAGRELDGREWNEFPRMPHEKSHAEYRGGLFAAV